MQFSNLSALSLSDLKALAISNNAIPTGDKRSKQSWIDAIELFQACETIVDDWVAPVTIANAEMECHAVAVDMAKEIIDRLEELSIEPDNETEAEWEARSGEYIGLSEVLGDIQSNKKGAETPVVALLCILVVAVQAVAVVAIALKKISTQVTVFASSIVVKSWPKQPDLDIACA